MGQSIGEKTFIDDSHRVVDRSNATCWFADLLDDDGLIVGEVFGLIIGSADT